MIRIALNAKNETDNVGRLHRGVLYDRFVPAASHQNLAHETYAGSIAADVYNIFIRSSFVDILRPTYKQPADNIGEWGDVLTVHLYFADEDKMRMI